MADRVLSTPTSVQAVQQMLRLTNQDLLNQLKAIIDQGNLLAEPNNWDGRLAGEYRGSWPGNRATLQKMQQDLATLAEQVQKINQNIMSAGGNA